MENQLVAVLSVIEGALYKEVKEFWKIFKEQYESQAVQVFEHPSFTIQGGVITSEKLKTLTDNFKRFASKIKPYNISVRKLGHIEEHTIYFEVEPEKEVQAVNILVNTFLGIFCDELIENYKPENYRPHIALAVNDLTESNFKRAWFNYGNITYQYDQMINNIFLVKFEKDGNLTLLEKAKLGTDVRGE
jgi:2'-5' RNA ligase